MRTVMCAKLGKELPSLEAQPFPGELGERIYEEVSAEGFEMWKPQMTILINHYGLNPVEPETRQFLREQMELFLFDQAAEMPDGWVAPETEPVSEFREI